MPLSRLAVAPVGRVESAEVEAGLARIAKVLRHPVDLLVPVAMPRGTEDSGRGQHDAARLLAALRAERGRLAVAATVGAATPGAALPTAPPVTVFVTDVDLFTASTEGVLAFLDAPHRAALVSVRRLREAFWRRKADPARQRARLVRQILRATGRVSGLPECNDAVCVVSPGDTLADLDRMSEAFCASCWKRLASGAVRP